MFDLNLKDKVILITGGSDGLGFSSAKLLSEQGAKIALCGRRGDYLKEKADIIREETKNDVLDIQCDVTNADQCKKLVEHTISHFKAIDVLVNNAGITLDNLSIRLTEENWKKVLDINLTSTFLISKFSIKKMIKNKSGKIINITSVVGHTGNVGQANYTASKALDAV